MGLAEKGTERPANLSVCIVHERGSVRGFREISESSGIEKEIYAMALPLCEEGRVLHWESLTVWKEEPGMARDR